MAMVCKVGQCRFDSQLLVVVLVVVNVVVLDGVGNCMTTTTRSSAVNSRSCNGQFCTVLYCTVLYSTYCTVLATYKRVRY
jgi:hypothetical protein